MRRKMKKSLNVLLALILVLGMMFTSVPCADIAYAAEQGVASEQVYTFRDLNKMTTAEILDLSENISWEDIKDLFQKNSDTIEFYRDRSRVEGIIDGLEQKGREYTSTDDKGIDTIVEILRSGYFLRQNCSELAYLKETEMKNRVIPALLSIANNRNFKLGEAGQDKVVKAYGKLIGNTASNAEVVNKITPILKQYMNNLDTFKNDRLKGEAFFKVFAMPTEDMGRWIYNNYHDKKANESPWFGKIDGFINEVVKIATSEEAANDIDAEWIVANGIYCIGELSKFHSNTNGPRAELERILDESEIASKSYLTALAAIRKNYHCERINGSKLDYATIIKQCKDIVLPNVYTFDDGDVIIRTGDKVTEDKVQRLYWASKEVKSQFHRLIGSDVQLEPGKADDKLNIVIYNSPKQYKLNTKLYGYSTDNGGMYIEGVGTFFTYERTPRESIYSLEELFRHEFTHYLQGKYLVPGTFGRGVFYDGNPSRLTWFEEGTAEFFAGSTRNKVNPRHSMTTGISTDTDEIYDIRKLVHSSYDDGWTFYTYGYAFADYMYRENRPLFKELFDYMIRGNVKEYDTLLERISNDYSMQKSYKEHAKKLAEKASEYDTPLVSDYYMEKTSDGDVNAIKNNILKYIDLRNVTVKTKQSDYFETFELKGKYTLRRDRGYSENWKTLDDLLNETITNISKLDWSGYKTVTAYFVNETKDKSGNITYDVVFHGLLKQNSRFNQTPVAVIDTINNVNVMKSFNLSANNSNDDGKIVKCDWDFGDGETAEGNNTSHVYKIPGKYIVKLTVTDDKGITASKEVEIFAVYELGEVQFYEKESNNYYTSANKIELGKVIGGSVSEQDTVDMFTFEIKEPTKISSILEQTTDGEVDCMYAIFKMSDRKDYLVYNTQKTKQLISSCDIDEAGEYIIIVYSRRNKKIDYKFIINDINDSNITDDDKNDDDNNNDNALGDCFENAIEIKNNDETKSSFSENVTSKYYKIDLKNQEEIEINLNIANASELNTINWLVFDGDNINDYYGYATKREKNSICGKIKASHDSVYYVVVYTVADSNSEYNLQLGLDNDMSKDNDKTSSTSDEDKIEVKNIKRFDSLKTEMKNNKTIMYKYVADEDEHIDVIMDNYSRNELILSIYDENNMRKAIASSDDYLRVDLKKGNYIIKITKNVTSDCDCCLTIY